MKPPGLTLMGVRLLFIQIFIFMSLIAYPQGAGTCADKLKDAQSFFEKGQVEKVPSLLNECLKSGFKREEELSAYKLLIQTYLLNDKINQADSSMFAFLKSNPEYQISTTDHSSFVYLFNNFNVKPVIQIGVHAGTNLPFLTFINPVSNSGNLLNLSTIVKQQTFLSHWKQNLS